MIFAPFLREYSHWAWVDKDTFVGDLTQWITRSDLNHAEVIGIGGTKHGGKIMLSTYGQLAIFQNTKRVNDLMLLDRDLLLKQFKRASTSSANTDEYGFNKLALAGPARDVLKPPLSILYIVFSSRKRHAALVKPPEDADNVPFTLVETSTCFRARPPSTGKDAGLASVCRKPDDAEAKRAMEFFKTTFEDFEGGTVSVPAKEMDCCGWWMGNNLLPKHSGWFKFLRDPKGQWLKRRAIERDQIRLVNTTGGHGQVIQWKAAIWAHVRTRMCVIKHSDLDNWFPIGRECAQGNVK